MKAPHPTARLAHRELAERYLELAVAIEALEHDPAAKRILADHRPRLLERIFGNQGRVREAPPLGIDDNFVAVAQVK